MISVDLWKDRVEINGHATDSPIACEAVTCLIQTLIASSEDLTTDPVVSDAEKGHAVFVNKQPSEKGQTLMDAFSIGIQMVSECYGEFIHLTKH